MNVAEKLAREIRRVAELRCQYEEVGKLPNVIVGPALMLMDAALEQACKAAGSDDALAQISALQDLQGFEK